nr:glycosyltransferase [Clostridia bacterium]
MKKLLFVIYSLGFGGAERSLVNLFNELPQDRYSIDLLLFQKRGAFLDYLPEWVNVLETPAAMDKLYAPVRKAGRYAVRKIAGTCCAKLARKTRKEQLAFRWRNFYRRKLETLPGYYDVAIAYGGTENLYYIGDCVNAGKKIVWIHNDYCTGGYSRQDDLPYLSRMDAVVSISKQCVEVLKSEFPEFQDRIWCIENITSSTTVRLQAEAFQPAEYTPGKTTILSVGRLTVQKGLHLAIEAAALLKAAGLDFQWFVLGRGPLQDELTELIKKQGVEDCFFLLGTRANPYPYIRQCTVFVQTSLYEGKSVVMDEAKILAKPIVTTNYPTVRDQIKDGTEGLIAEMSAQSIAWAIRRILDDKRLCQSLADYLNGNEYGNCGEVEKYIQVIEK